MAWSVQDLAEVTHLLIHKLHHAIKNSPRHLANPFHFDVSGLMPAVSRTDGTNVLSLYLLHVGRDPHWRNTPIGVQTAQLNTSQPLSLNLSYLLTSYSEKNWHMEQYLMSVALQYFHANPIFIDATTGIEFTVTVEADSIEEMSRLWQAITVPIRLSAMFRVAVVFLTPETPAVADQRMPVEVSLSVAPDLNLPAPVPEPGPQLFEIAPQIAYRVPPSATDASGDTDLSQITTVLGQPAAAAGESVRVQGSGLDQINAAAVYLSPAPPPPPAVPPAVTPEWPVTGWLPPASSGSLGNADELVVWLPAAYGATPASGTPLAATPPPGNYLIAVGNATTSVRSNALPLAIGPAVTGIGTGSPVLTPTPSPVGVYTFAASVMIAGETSILLGNTTLTVAAAVGPGLATVDAVTNTVTFELPTTGLTSGSYLPVRVVVNSVEAPPGWWVLVP